MAKINWDQAGSRTYEGGVDRGVLYQTDGLGVPWNGLTDVSEINKKTVESIYYDGVKVNDLVKLGDYTGTLKAITYPDEFLEYEGYGRMVRGVYIGEQQPKTFGLSYRTKVGSDVDNNAGYKIHILYNVTATPSTKNYSTISDSTDLTDFQWNLTAVPEYVDGWRPSAHIVVDSRYTDAKLFSDIELVLYGGETADATLPAFDDLMEMIQAFFLVEIVDNNDGTWTAYSDYDGYINMVTEDEFRLDNVNAVYLDAETYELSDTQ